MIRRLGKKKAEALALAGKPWPRSSITASRKAPRKRKRKPSETLRIYGPPGYLDWIHQQPCVGCGFVPSSCAHIKTGGMGRKDDWTRTVPLCEARYDVNGRLDEGCHGLFHHWGRETFEAIMLIDLDIEAKNTQAAWQDHLTGESQ